MKLLIIGSVGSGKTTLAKRLSKECNIKYYEIDSIVHDDVNHRKRTDDEQQEIIRIINKNSDWILEGTLRRNLYNILNYADKIIYIDIPLNIRKRRILIRFFKQKIGIEKCNYKPTFRMLKMMYLWTADFEKNREVFEEHINNYARKLVKIDNIDKLNDFHL